MPPSSAPSSSGSPVLLSAPGLGVVALVLFVLFASLVAAVLFPLLGLALVLARPGLGSWSGCSRLGMDV